jgi:alkanesulfonate monooxygenase SsuD/methylene tetrahydromethanopterin reductase-like flavin-dependent oxidoreductase (luciferase family)
MATSRYIEEVMRPAIAEGAEAEGRHPEEIEVADWVVVGVSEDVEQARADVKRQIAFHATVRTYDRILALHGFDAVASEIRALWKRFDLAGMTALVTDEMLAAMGVAGSAEECRRQLAERARSADLILLGAPIVATDPDRARGYHQALLEAFGRIQ